MLFGHPDSHNQYPTIASIATKTPRIAVSGILNRRMAFKAAHSWMEILSKATDPWRLRDAYKPVGETGDELLGGFRAAASSDMAPNLI